MWKLETSQVLNLLDRKGRLQRDKRPEWTWGQEVGEARGGRVTGVLAIIVQRPRLMTRKWNPTHRSALLG